MTGDERLEFVERQLFPTLRSFDKNQFDPKSLGYLEKVDFHNGRKELHNPRHSIDTQLCGYTQAFKERIFV
jgi:hypothetical protein